MHVSLLSAQNIVMADKCLCEARAVFKFCFKTIILNISAKYQRVVVFWCYSEFISTSGKLEIEPTTFRMLVQC